MNEKIKNLVEQCTTVEHGVIQPRSRGDVYHFDKEKFAELIVHDCVKIAELKEQGYNEYDSDVSVGWYIKEHFGIK